MQSYIVIAQLEVSLSPLSPDIVQMHACPASCTNTNKLLSQSVLGRVWYTPLHALSHLGINILSWVTLSSVGLVGLVGLVTVELVSEVVLVRLY